MRNTFYYTVPSLLLLVLLLGLWREQWLAADPEPQPLYWVAPMDPDYRRDGPGKSPMGMDLVPVYADRGPAQGSAGVVQIDPTVQHNLGLRTTVVKHQTLKPSMVLQGYIAFDESRIAQVHPRVEGWIDELLVNVEDQYVVEGDVLFTLYSPTLVAAQEELLVALNRRDTDLTTAAIERLQVLDVPNATIDYVKRHRRVQRTVTILAPTSGIVTRIGVREGMYVQPNLALLTITPNNPVWVIGDLTQSNFDQTILAAPVRVHVPGISRRHYQTSIDYAYPTLDPKRRTVRVRASLTNSEGDLKPGQYAELRVDLPAIDDVLAVPASAVIPTGQQHRVVLQLDTEQFKSIAVSIGRQINDWIEVLDGLEAGDRVVTAAHFLIDSESSRSSDFVRLGMSPGATQLDEPDRQSQHKGDSHANHHRMTHGYVPPKPVQSIHQDQDSHRHGVGSEPLDDAHQSPGQPDPEMPTSHNHGDHDHD